MAGTPAFPHVFTEGDTLPEILGVLKDVDITGHTIELHLDRPDGVANLIKAAVIVDAVQGQFKFTWTPTDLVAGIGQLAAVRIINTSAQPLTEPERFTIDVLELPSA